MLGDVITDVSTRLRETPVPGSDAAADIRLGGGGSAANVACWLAAAGSARDVHLVGRVGDDPSGRERTAELDRAGVRTHLAVDAERPTGAIVVLVEASGERTMLTDRGANLRLAPADAPPGLVEEAAWVHVSGYALLDAGPRPAALAVLDRAHAAGVAVSLDPASSHPLALVGPSRVLGWGAQAALWLPNGAEAEVLTGCADPAAAARALGGAGRECVVTLGADGCVWSDGSRTLHTPAAPAQVVDTTGAGDAFTAGYLSARVDGADPQECCARAVALAARAVATAGARP